MMTETLLIISYDELCQIEGLDSDFIFAIVEYGIVTPIDKYIENKTDKEISHEQKSQWLFDSNSVYWIKKASRLHSDLELEWLAVAMVIDLMRENETAKKEMAIMQRQLKRFLGEEHIHVCD